jgi:RNA polymerase sigma-70 factor (ECF subfamily)
MIAMTTPPDSLADSKGLRAAYDECAPRIRRYLTHVLRDEHAAEDVLQQVMLEGWQRSASYDPARGSRMTWLMTIARSRAIDYLRRQVPEPHDPQTTTAMIDRVAAEEVAADRLAGQAALAQLLRRIPVEEAELLRMRFHLDMTQSEIAEATGIPLGTVKMRMVAALRRLREMLDAEGEGAT